MPSKKYFPDKDGNLAPEGVTLYNPDDPDSKRNIIYDSVRDAFTGTFPRTYGKVTVSLDQVDYDGPEVADPQTETDAIRKNKFLYRRLRGNMRVADAETGELLDEKMVTLARVPMLTRRGTFVHNGIDYTTAFQSRLIPGVYHRRRASGDVAAQFNVKRGTGSGFDVSMEPSTGIFRLEIKGSKLPLYSVLTKLGYTDKELESAWGSELLAVNKTKSSARDWPKAVGKILGLKAGDPDSEETTVAVKEFFDNLTFNRGVFDKNMPTILS